MGVKGVVGTVVVLGVLAGGAVVADRVVHARTEDRLAAELEQSVPGLTTTPDVSIEGFPFLNQVLAGELDTVTATAPGVTVEGLTLDDVDVHLTGVTTDAPHTAHHARMTASLDPSSVGDLLPLDADVSVDGEHVVLTTTLLDLPVDVLLTPSAAGREVRIDVDGLRVGGVGVNIDDLPLGVTDQLEDLHFPVDALPEGLELTEVRVADGVLALAAEGTDVTFETTD